MGSFLRHLAALVLLILLLLAIYRPALTGDYVFDDISLIRDHKQLNDVPGLITLWINPAQSPDYYPLTYSSWWLERKVFGQSVVAHHVGNVVLHAINSLLVFLLLKRLVHLRAPRVQSTTGVAIAGLAALVFALHPVHVESVAWMSERKDVLSGLFYFLSLLALLRAVTPANSARDQQSTGAGSSETLSLGFFALSVFLFLCAMFSKPVTMTMAAAVLLMVWLVDGRWRWDRAWLAIPYFLLAIPMAVLTVWLQKHQVLTEGADFDLSFAQRVVLSGRVFWFYLYTDFWPVKLAFAYPRWTIDAASAVQWLAPLTAGAILAAAWLLRRRITIVPFIALAYCVVTLSPALGYFNIFWHTYYYVVDHVQYLACLGPIALAATGVVLLARRVAPAAGWITPVVSLVLLAPLGWISANRAATYTDSITLWSDVVERYPDSFLGQSNLGMCLLNERSDPAAAIAPLERAAALRPESAYVHFQLGRAYNGAYRREEAVRAWETAIRIDPNDGVAQLSRSAIATLRPGEITDQPPK